MSFLDQVSVLILTYNETPNIKRTLDRLTWAKRIVVIDSGSTDDTVEIIRRTSQAEVVYRPFDNFATQCNFGLSQISSEWVLSLDADYNVSEELIAELKGLAPDEQTSGFSANFIYRVYGHPLRANLYPPRTVLYRRERAKYRNEGHGHRVTVDGLVEPLKAKIYHDDRKPLSRWLSSQQRYARDEADHLLANHAGMLRRPDYIRRMAWPAPPLVFLYTLFVKGCLLDGWPGWFYALQRTLAESLIAIEIVDRRIRGQEQTDRT